MEPRYCAYFRQAGPRQAWPVPNAADPTEAARIFVSGHRPADPDLKTIEVMVVNGEGPLHAFCVDVDTGEARPLDSLPGAETGGVANPKAPNLT